MLNDDNVSPSCQWYYTLVVFGSHQVSIKVVVFHFSCDDRACSGYGSQRPTRSPEQSSITPVSLGASLLAFLSTPAGSCTVSKTHEQYARMTFVQVEAAQSTADVLPPARTTGKT